jgi:26S proteasome regulatory subunit N11
MNPYQNNLAETMPMSDTSEQIKISSLALLKMLKHCKYIIIALNIKKGRAGVPFEVMGVLLGEFIDDYIVQVVDVYAMP